MREKKPYKAAPPLNGSVICSRGHEWDVRDVNPERVTVKCPVCGGNTDILQGMGKSEQRK